MAPKQYTQMKFDETRHTDDWTRVREFATFAQFEAYLDGADILWLQGPRTRDQLGSVLPQARAQAAAFVGPESKPLVALDRSARTGFLSVYHHAASTVTVWNFELDGADPQQNFERMAVIARGDRDGVLRLVPQEDKSYMWRAPLVHPMQVRENSYQRVVRAAGRDPGDVDSSTTTAPGVSSGAIASHAAST